MRIRRTIIFVLLWMAALVCSATTVTGTLRYNGTPFTGFMTVQLSYPATSGTYISLPIQSAPISIQNGTFASLILDGNDVLLPRKSYYAFNIYGPSGAWVARLNYFISGTSFDIGSAVPTPVLTNNVNFLDLLGIRNLSVTGTASFAQLQFGSGISITPAGIFNAESIMGILFAQAFNQQNFLSTTCGVSEAIAALPPSGGTIVLAPGNCNLTSTILITRGQVAIVGQGPGGYSGVSTTLLPSTLTQTTPGIPAISISPSSGLTASGVSLRNFALVGGTSSLISIGSVDSTSHLRDVTLDGIWASGSSGPCLSVVGNLYGLSVSSSSFISCQSGLVFNATAAGISFDSITLGPRVLVSHSTLDGINVSGAGAGRIVASDLHSTFNSGSGVAVQSSASSSSFLASHSEFASNTVDGLLLAGGFGHSVFSSSISSSGSYGIDVTSTASSGSQTFSTGDSTFVSNATADLHTGTSVPWVTVYPQVSRSASVVQATPATVRYVQVGFTP